ncbi:MAG TPA: hypothetical protein VFR29_04590 [Steroidobacteraceae bacterium]|nr:hypothetical protein [Steroidobacteraceae bacterium]
MAICHEHNLRAPPPESRPFGIRVTLDAQDPFTRLVDAGWRKEHWFATAQERDEALADMASQHLYSREGDAPSVRYEKIG